METKIGLTPRLAMIVKLSEHFQTPTIMMIRETNYGTKRRLFVSPGQYSIMADSADETFTLGQHLKRKDKAGTACDNPCLNIPIDEYKSLSVTRYAGRISVSIKTSKMINGQHVEQEGLTFSMDMDSEYTMFINKRSEVLKALKKLKAHVPAPENDSTLSLYRWMLINRENSERTTGKRLFMKREEAYGAGRTSSCGNVNLIVCVEQLKFPMPSIQEVAFCVLLAQTTEAYERSVRLNDFSPIDVTPEDIYDECRRDISAASTGFLVADIFKSMNASRVYKGLESMEALTPEEEEHIKDIVLQRKQTVTLTDLQKAMLLDIFDLSLQDYPDWAELM